MRGSGQAFSVSARAHARIIEDGISKRFRLRAWEKGEERTSFFRGLSCAAIYVRILCIFRAFSRYGGVRHNADLRVCEYRERLGMGSNES